MRRSNNFLLRALYILLLSALLTFPMLAADAQQEDLRVWPDEASEAAFQNVVTARSALDGAADEAEDTRTAESRADAQPSKTVPTFTSGSAAVELIKKYEGFTAKRYWDTNRYAIGYGTSYDSALAKFPELKPEGTKDEDVTVTEAQAEILMREHLSGIETFLNGILTSCGIALNQNQFDALVDFTYNVGSGWWTYKNTDGTYCLLRQLLLDDPSTWTQERVSGAFGTWRTADGKVLEGLVQRRAEEAKLFMTPYTGVFSDVSESAWYYDWVNAAYDQGLVKGDGNGHFRPDDNMSRAELVQVLANLAGVDLSQYGGSSSFTDVSVDAWYAPAVAWGTEQGLIFGWEGKFSPEDPIRREHACNILARYLRSAGITEAPEAAPFADEDLMENADAKENIYFCAGLGIVNGVGNNLFDPRKSTTRGEMAKLIVGVKAQLDSCAEAA